jgi:hypothetical protein
MDFAVQAEANFILVANVCVYENNYWENYQNIAGSNAAPDNLAEKGYAWLEEKSEYTKDDIDNTNDEIENMYKELILVEFDGKEAAELDSAVRDMYQGYVKLYDLSNSSASKNGLSTFKSTYNDAFDLFSTAKNTMSLFIEFPEDDEQADSSESDSAPGASESSDVSSDVAPVSASEVSEDLELELPDFETLSYSGSGDSVITDIDLPEGAVYYAYLTHSGSRNFIVKAYDSSDRHDLLVNEIGNYYGSCLITLTDVSRIEVTASGDWSINISQLTFPDGNRDITSLSGSGAYVSYIFDAPAGTWSFTHDGSRNFIVYAYFTDGTSLSTKNRDLVINEIGVYSGDHYISVPTGKHIILSIEADGNWTANFNG